MTQNIFLLIILLFSASFYSKAQEDIYLEFNPSEIAGFRCPLDSAELRFRPKKWEIYQTINDEWDGERLATNCIFLRKNTISTDRWGVDFESIDRNHALFYRYTWPELPLIIDTSSVYFMNGGIFSFYFQDHIRFDSECPDQMCTGAILISRLSEGDTSLLLREDFTFSEENSYLGPCYPTQGAGSIELEEMIYKITFQPDVVNQEQSFSPSDFALRKHFSELITDDLEVDAKYLVDSSYDVSMSDLVPWSYAYLVTNKNEGLPDINRQSITFIKPKQTEMAQKTINLSLQRTSSLYYQLHTSLQGGPVGDSDSLFHILNIIDDEGSCSASTERLFQNYTNFVLNGTQIDFANRTACLQFRNHANMVLPPHQFDYGSDGIGMLNLRSGSSIQFQEGSDLHFDGMLLIEKYAKYYGDQDIHVDLPGGSKWHFSEDALIESRHGALLYIHMKGGQLDLTHLSKESRSHIQVVYSEAPARSKIPQSSVFPNPTSDFVQIYCAQAFKSVQIYNMHGVLLEKYTFPLNTVSHLLDLSGFPPGIYSYQITGGSPQVGKIVVQ